MLTPVGESPERQTLLGRLSRALERRVFAQPGVAESFTVYGNGVGDKVRELALRTPEILAAGFGGQHRSVIGMDIVDGIYRRYGIDVASINSLETASAARRLFAPARLNADEMRIIHEIIDRYRTVPGGVAVRSSAIGDAAGTGIYHSQFASLDPQGIEFAFLTVAGSYLSFDAAEFRRITKLPLGFAIFIEPLCCNPVFYKDFNGDLKPGHAPLYAGYGYTDSLEGPYIVVGEGFASDLVTNGSLGVRLTKENAHDFDMLLLDRDKPPEGFSDRTVIFADYKTDRGLIQQRNTPHDFSFMFRRMQALQKSLGKPHYFEFAIVERQGEFVPILTQIADAEQPSSEHAIALLRSTHNGVAFETHDGVFGSGIVEIKTLFYLHNQNGLQALENFNAANIPYVLIMNSFLLSSTLWEAETSQTMPCRYYSNAAVILPIWKSSDHGRTLSSHFKGAANQAGKIRGAIVVDRADRDRTARQDTFLIPYGGGDEGKERGYTTTDISWRVVADAQMRRLIVLDSTIGRISLVLQTNEQVIGAGLIETQRVFYLNHFHGLEVLQEFNLQNQNYTLFVNSELLSSAVWSNEADHTFPFRYYSNASVILAVWDTHRHYLDQVSSHLQGAALASGKLLAVIGRQERGARKSQRDLRERFSVDADRGYSITDMPLRVTSNGICLQIFRLPQASANRVAKLCSENPFAVAGMVVSTDQPH